MQNTQTIMMVRPARFQLNDQTVGSNAFQDNSASGKSEEVSQKAVAEFDNFVQILQKNGVNVIVVQDTMEPPKPDSLFPNNWVSFHADGTVVLYPMEAVNRRWERRRAILDLLRTEFDIKNEIDLSFYEQENKFLEGTGSLILDRENKIAYACLSSRTNPEILEDFAKKMDFEVVSFWSTDRQNKAIYHTNVMMCVGKKYVVICLESIKDAAERQKVVQIIQKTDKEIIEISFEQVESFAGNMLEVVNKAGESKLVMSEQAFKSLNTAQIGQIEKYSQIVSAPIYTIERYGGGSARCMLAEVFLPKKNQ